MRVVSGAGEFEMRVTKVVNEDQSVVMVGQMGYWEAKLILKRREAISLAKAMALPLLRALMNF